MQPELGDQRSHLCAGFEPKALERLRYVIRNRAGRQVSWP
jgi:hypothetical protein